MSVLRRLVPVAALVLVAGSTACERHVVLEPEVARTKNQSAWTVTSEPGSAKAAPSASIPATRDLPPAPPAPSDTSI